MSAVVDAHPHVFAALVDDHLAFLSEAERDAVRGGNALRLFRF